MVTSARIGTMNLFVLALAATAPLGLAACSSATGSNQPDPAGGGGGASGGTSASSSGGGRAHASSSSTGGGGGGGAGGEPVACNGYEPCGVHPVVVPDGYTLQAGVDVSNLNTTTSCAAFADCDMWNTHFTSIWQPCSGCGEIDNTWNRMGSPFPWPGSRYVIVVTPKRVQYAKLHLTAPGERYLYGDGTPEMHTDKDTGVTSCYQRGPGHLVTSWLSNMGGTGNLGKVTFNISVLPGDMGNSGNASTCAGTGSTNVVLITSDEAKASIPDAQGHYDYCLLREGQDYYVNFMSSGGTPSIDCGTAACTMGGFAFNNPTTSDGSPFVAAVPCD